MSVVTVPTTTRGLDGGTITWPDGTVWPPPSDGSIPAVRAPLADFGPSVASTDVDQAVIDVLRTWLPTYLGFVERSRALSYQLPRPHEASFASTVDPEQFLDRVLPGVFVATARTQGTPLISADGFYETEWLVALSCVVRGRTADETRVTASLYELAARMVMVHQLPGTPIGKDFTPPVDVNALACRWLAGGESRPLDDPNGRGRWLGEGASQFAVFTDAAVAEGLGPVVPDQNEYLPLATVEDVTVEIDGVPINTSDGGN